MAWTSVVVSIATVRVKALPLFMRVFIKLRRFVLDNKALRRELEDLKQQTENRFQIVFETLDRLIAIDEKPKRKIGF